MSCLKRVSDTASWSIAQQCGARLSIHILNFWTDLLLFCLSLSGRAGPLPIKGNKLLGSLGYRSYPQGALLQAEWLRAEWEVGAIYPDSVWSRGTSHHGVVRSAVFFTWWCFLECDLSDRRSVAVLCLLFRIESNSMHPLSSALPMPYVLARVSHGSLVAHRHSFTPRHCSTSLYRRTFVPGINCLLTFYQFLDQILCQC